MNCPNDELLSAYHDGEVPQAEARAISSHVASCRDCLARLETIRAANAAILEGFDSLRRAAPRRHDTSGASRSLLSRPLVLASAAAVLLAAAGLFVCALRGPEPSPPTGNRSPQAELPAWLTAPPEVPAIVAESLKAAPGPLPQALLQAALTPRAYCETPRVPRRLAADELPSWKVDYYLEQETLRRASVGALM